MALPLIRVRLVRVSWRSAEVVQAVDVLVSVVQGGAVVQGVLVRGARRIL